MNLRYVVPAFSLLALSATAASAQEIAKGVTLDGYLDTIATATTNTAPKEYSAPSTTDFYSEANLRVGWSITDKVKTVISTRTYGDQGGFAFAEGYATVQATPELTVSAGKSAGPFGYYSFYPTGLTTTNYALTLNMYTVNPVGVWAAYTKEKFTVTAILADQLYNSGTSAGSTFAGGYLTNPATAKSRKPGTVAPGLDVVFLPTDEIALNLEGYVDPSAGGPSALGTAGNIDGYGDVIFIGFNGQYKKDKILAGGEVLYQIIQDNYVPAGATSPDDTKNLSWAAYLTYTLPFTMPSAGTVQVSQYLPGDPNKDTLTKLQLALLTNPFTESTFGLNYEVFAILDGAKGNSSSFNSTDVNKKDAVTTFGFSIEGLFVIP